jgi:hypothetical protein
MLSRLLILLLLTLSQPGRASAETLQARKSTTPPVSAAACSVSTVCLLPASLVHMGVAYDGLNTLWLTDSNGVIRINLPACTSSGCAFTRPGGRGLAYDGTYLYQYFPFSGVVYKLNPNTCAVVDSCLVPGGFSEGGLASDGQYLFRVDAGTIWRFTPPPECNVVSSCPNPTGLPADGLATCGDFLIMLGPDDILYSIRLTTCEVEASCQMSGSPWRSITSENGSSLFAISGANEISLRIARVPVDCAIPTRTESSTWGQIKALLE